MPRRHRPYAGEVEVTIDVERLKFPDGSLRREDEAPMEGDFFKLPDGTLVPEEEVEGVIIPVTVTAQFNPGEEMRWGSTPEDSDPGYPSDVDDARAVGPDGEPIALSEREREHAESKIIERGSSLDHSDFEY